MKDFEINDIKFKFEENVKTYSIGTNDLKNHISNWNFVKHINNSNINTSYYLLFETRYHYTIGHWFYESAIYLLYFEKIKQILKNEYGINNIRIHYTNKPFRSYKKLYFDLFGIKNDELYDGDLPENNICIYFDLIMIHSQKENLDKEFRHKKIYNDYIEFINKQIQTCNENIDILVFLRTQKPIGEREVETTNDRIIDYSNLYEFLKSTNRKIKYFNPSDECTSIIEQIKLVKSSKILIVEYGSGMYLNGFFSKNLIMIGGCGKERHYLVFNSDRIIFDVIKSNNKIFSLKTIQIFSRKKHNNIQTLIICKEEFNKLDRLIKFLIDNTDYKLVNNKYQCLCNKSFNKINYFNNHISLCEDIKFLK